MRSAIEKLKQIFFKKDEELLRSKKEINFTAFKVAGVLGLLVFLIVVLLAPDEESLEYSEKVEGFKAADSQNMSSGDEGASNVGSSQKLWGRPQIPAPVGGSNVNYNSSMVLNSSNGNAKVNLHAGTRISIRLLDKTVVSEEAVPVMGEVLTDAVSESGLRIPAGTKVYGEASFSRGSSRAQIKFRQLSLPSGAIQNIFGNAFGKDDQVGVVGKVFSDGVKNTTGQLITTFVAGIATGSIETNIWGQSKGGIKNGVLSALGATAKDRAQNYGDKLKTEREWMELENGLECELILQNSFNLQNQNEGGGL